MHESEGNAKHESEASVPKISKGHSMHPALTSRLRSVLRRMQLPQRPITQLSNAKELCFSSNYSLFSKVKGKPRAWSPFAYKYLQFPTATIVAKSIARLAQCAVAYTSLRMCEIDICIFVDFSRLISLSIYKLFSCCGFNRLKKSHGNVVNATIETINP